MSRTGLDRGLRRRRGGTRRPGRRFRRPSLCEGVRMGSNIREKGKRSYVNRIAWKVEHKLAPINFSQGRMPTYHHFNTLYFTSANSSSPYGSCLYGGEATFSSSRYSGSTWVLFLCCSPTSRSDGGGTSTISTVITAAILRVAVPRVSDAPKVKSLIYLQRSNKGRKESDSNTKQQRPPAQKIRKNWTQSNNDWAVDLQSKSEKWDLKTPASDRERESRPRDVRESAGRCGSDGPCRNRGREVVRRCRRRV